MENTDFINYVLTESEKNLGVDRADRTLLLELSEEIRGNLIKYGGKIRVCKKQLNRMRLVTD